LNHPLCKAFLIQTGTAPVHAQASHAYVARPLPLIIREEMQEQNLNVKKMAWLQKRIRRIADEIELLNPAVDREGRRPDNCEYPWRIGDRIFSPLDATFNPSDLLSESSGRTFLKLLRAAIDRVLRQARARS
jgi:hypothetical protein